MFTSYRVSQCVSFLCPENDSHFCFCYKYLSHCSVSNHNVSSYQPFFNTDALLQNLCNFTRTLDARLYAVPIPCFRERGSFIHLVVCLTTGPKPLPKRPLHTVRSRASSFKLKYPLLSLKSSSSFLRFLPCLPVTSIPPLSFL
jgi:hypothetical protein